jgi:pimeloyl-ACP methyl ester carboxylesterase
MKHGSSVGIAPLLGLLLAACGRAEVQPTGEVGATLHPSPRPAILAGPGEPGTFEPAACRFVLPEEVREGVDVDCGYLSVLEQRGSREDSSDGRVIMLAVAVFHPPGGATRSDPVIYLSGGPGASSLESIRYQLELFTDLVFPTGRDLVLFDQRGVGLSRPALDCPGFYELSRELLDREVDGQLVTDEQISDSVWDEVIACRQALERVADLSAYNSAASAADVEDLRLALGYAEINLWGGSYGTRLALEVMRRYPTGLRSVVLDAVYPPDVDLYVQAPANFERALDRLFEACAANALCKSAHPDLRATFFDTVERLNTAPVLLETEDPFTNETRRTWLNGNSVLALTFQLLYDSRLRYLLPEQFEAAAQGDYRAFELAITALARMASISSRGMMLSVQCHEEIAFSSIEAFEAEAARHPDVAGMYANSLLGGMAYRACEAWDAGQAEAAANEAVAGDVPTLLMAGEFDPITPPAWARHAAETLTHAYVYEYPGIGHGASGLPGCPQQMFVAFLENPLTAPEATCLAGMR